MNYEDALEKYARIKLKCKPKDTVENASVDSSTYSVNGCHTCGPEFETEITLSARINGKYKSTVVGDGYSGFGDVLRDILEAA